MQALWMVLGAFLFASMGVCLKIASAWYSTPELVFYRGLIGVLVVWIITRTSGVRVATRYPGMHAWRSLIGTVSLAAWFYSLSKIPLSTAMTLNYMSSVWIAAFLVGGALMAWAPLPGRDGRAARPPLQAALVLTVLAGFAGVVLMLRPSMGSIDGFGTVLGLLSGMTGALAYMQVVALSRLGEPEARTVFYFALGASAAGGLGTLV